jgi:magnesium-transporting ATPase (P-type)
MFYDIVTILTVWEKYVHVGTNTTSGRAIAVAVKTDVLTEMGIIVAPLQEAKPQSPHCKKAQPDQVAISFSFF